MRDCAAAAALPHGLADLQRARHRQRHARGDALLRRAVACSAATIRYMDVGGGLGVDYEGTRSRSYCSINYGLDQFAHTHRAAAGRGLRGARPAAAAHRSPRRGRAMTAHHAVMVVNVSEVEQAPEGRVPPTSTTTSRRCSATCARSTPSSTQRPALELYHEAQQRLAEGHVAVRAGPARPRRSARARRPVLRHRARACARA